MNEKNTGHLPTGITVDDILYILFRHKWKIGIISSVAILASSLAYLLWPVPYKSEAKLLIKYVVDSRNSTQMGANNSRVTTPDDRGDSILNTELEVLSSFDLALRVAEAIGPTNLLAKTGGGTNVYAAAGVIQKNLILEIAKKSSVIHLTFQHPDIALVQPVLKALIEDYYKRHLEIHRDVGEFGEFLTQQTDQLHSRLLQTEEALRAAKTNAGVISIEDTKKLYSDQVARIQAEILQAEADLAERQAAASEMAKLTHSELPVFTNAVAETNEVPVPSDKLSEYKRLCSLLDRLSARQQELLVQFTPENSWVKQIEEQIAAKEAQRDKLEKAYPGLAAKSSLVKFGGGDTRGAAQLDMVTELAKVSGLQSKIKLLNQQLDDIQRIATRMYASEASISDLQRKYYLQETQYNYFSMSLEQSRIDDALGASRVSNISQIQAPTPPSRDHSKIQKAATIILAGGIALAVGLAFLIEFYLDRSIRRFDEIETKLGLPLYISIPHFASTKKSPGLKAQGKVPLLFENSSETKSAATPDHDASSSAHSNGNGAKFAALSPPTDLAPWHPRYILRPFADALRDGLITFFEVNNLTHKPKLVAITSCTQGAGVSTIAASLAASLSETGEGNVLLVNMSQADGIVHQFHKGDVACDFDDVLATEKRSKALVQDNLYVVTEATDGEKLPIVFPNRFKSLVPRLRASDYDYIIFDMPAVSQISSTLRLARFMDMVLMVVESEKTDRDVAKRVSSLLSQTKTNLGVVLNKTRSRVPKALAAG